MFVECLLEDLSADHSRAEQEDAEWIWQHVMEIPIVGLSLCSLISFCRGYSKSHLLWQHVLGLCRLGCSFWCLAWRSLRCVAHCVSCVPECALTGLQMDVVVEMDTCQHL
jgi:hypothetical protein